MPRSTERLFVFTTLSVPIVLAAIAITLGTVKSIHAPWTEAVPQGVYVVPTAMMQEAFPCNAIDLAEPFGELNYLDAVSFFDAIDTFNDIADVAEPFGVLDDADIFAFVGAVSEGCPPAPTLPDVPYAYANVELPAHFLINGFPPQMGFQSAAIDHDNTPADNPTTDAGATLGRVLFYDVQLSANGTRSCASCHVQSNGFSDVATLSVGFDGGETGRHSMSLANARFHAAGRFFWDERAGTLEEQVLQPFQDPVEMGLTLDQLVELVESQPYYPELFADAFGNDSVTADRISRALAQFVRSMVSFTSRYDEGRAAVTSPLDDFPNFTAQENQGKRIFMGAGGRQPFSCAQCHSTEAFINVQSPTPAVTSALNIGLDAVSTGDVGVASTSGRVQDTGKFKVPSLRNIGVGAPYMHDGRFATLEEVVNHYATGIQNHPQLAPQLRNPGTGQPHRLNLNPNQRAALVAFLETLDDDAFMTDVKFSDPFER